MENKELHFLAKISDVLTKEVDTAELVSELQAVLSSFVKINKIKLYVFDSFCGKF